MSGFVEIDGRRFELSSARLWLYHCASSEADWNLRLEWDGGGGWLAGTVEPSPTALADLDGRAMRIELRDLDVLFEQLLGTTIMTYPGGQDVCRAEFSARVEGDAVTLETGFEFEWDGGGSERRSVRARVVAPLAGLHPAALPEAL